MRNRDGLTAPEVRSASEIGGDPGLNRNGNRARGLAGAGGADKQHVRMFVLSHYCGPFIGLALSGFLLMLGFPIDWRLGGFTALVCLFWIYPAALKLGVSYALLSATSLQHLTFVILWAAHGYGGLTSPFLLWLAVVPLLAFLYSAPQIRLWLVLAAMLVLNIAIFAVITQWLVPPPAADPEALRWLAALSLLSASAYIWMMAGYFGRVLNSRNEMAQEVARRRASVAQLDRRATDLRHIRAARAASLARLVEQCRGPMREMLAHSGSAEAAANHSSGETDPDLLNVEEAARRLGSILARVEQFTRELSRGGSRTGRFETGPQL